MFFKQLAVEKKENGLTFHLLSNSGKTTAVYEIDATGTKEHFKDSDGKEFWNELNDSKTKSIHYRQSNGYESWNEYDANEHVTHYREVNDNHSYETWHEYDANGNEIYFHDSAGLEQWQEYNSKNLCIHFKDSTGFEEFYDYTKDGDKIKIEKGEFIMNEVNARIYSAFDVAKKYVKINPPINRKEYSSAEKGVYILSALESARDYYAENSKDFAMPLQELEKLIKGKDAVEYGKDSLDFIRPTAEQMEDGLMEGWSFEQITRGYGISTDSKLPNGLEIITKIDDMMTFESDEQAAQQAWKDGIKHIKSLDYKFGYEPDSVLSRCSSIIIDNENNRNILKEHLLPENVKNNVLVLNDILLEIDDENHIFAKDGEVGVYYDDFIKNELFVDWNDKTFTRGQMASILLQNSFVLAGLNSYPETWKTLLKDADDIGGAVYAAASDAYLGDNLRFLIENASEEQWNTLKADRSVSLKILQAAESSILNDHDFTVNPTLELAEKLGLEKAAVHYVNSIINDYLPGYSNEDTFQYMCSSLEKYCEKNNIQDFFARSRNHYNLPKEIELTRKDLEENRYSSESSRKEDEKHLHLVTAVLKSIDGKLNYELEKEYSLREKNTPYYTVDTGYVPGNNDTVYVSYDENNWERVLDKHFSTIEECQDFCDRENFKILKSRIEPKFVDVVDISSGDNTSSYRYDIKISKDDRFFKNQLGIKNDNELWKNENDYVSLVIDINEKSTAEDIKIDFAYIRIDDSTKTEDFLTEIELNLNESLKKELCEKLTPLVMEKNEEMKKSREYKQFAGDFEQNVYLKDTALLKDMYLLSEDDFLKKHSGWNKEYLNRAKFVIYDAFDKDFKESTFYKEIFQTKDRGSEYALDLEMPYLNDSPENSFMRIFSSAEVKKGDELKLDMEFDNLARLSNIHVIHERGDETLSDHSIDYKKVYDTFGIDFVSRCNELVKLNLYEYHNNMSLKETYFLTPKAFSSFNNFGKEEIQEFRKFFNWNKTDKNEPSLSYEQAAAVMDSLTTGDYGLYTDEKGNAYIYDKADDTFTGEGTPVGNNEIIDFAMTYAEKNKEDGIVNEIKFNLVKDLKESYQKLKPGIEQEKPSLSYSESEDFIKDFIQETKNELSSCKNNPIAAMSKVINSWEKDSEKRKVIDSYLRVLNSQDKFIRFAKEIVSEKPAQQISDGKKKNAGKTSKDDDFGRV